jgi:hypothetical protein
MVPGLNGATWSAPPSRRPSLPDPDALQQNPRIPFHTIAGYPCGAKLVRLALAVQGDPRTTARRWGVVDMHAGRWQGSRAIPGRERIATLVVLFAFSLSALGLPVHLVHHLGEINPACQLLSFSVSLNAGSLDSGWFPNLGRACEAVSSPVLSPSVPLLGESAQARAPPPAVRS